MFIKFLRWLKGNAKVNKHIRYLSYVLIHKWYVFVECCKYKEAKMIWRGIMHDLSKFSPMEWNAYVNYFYGKDNAIDLAINMALLNAFDYAWNHHQKVNKHHWQYFILKEDNGSFKALEMPDTYNKEMLADWRAAGIAINGYDATVKWYENNKIKMILHENTKKWIEIRLGLRCWDVDEPCVPDSKTLCDECHVLGYIKNKEEK
jgi:hypothetical protein